MLDRTMTGRRATLIWRCGAAVYAVAVLVLSLMPAGELVNWMRPFEVLTSDVQDQIPRIASLTAAVLLLLLLACRLVRLRIPVTRRLRLSRGVSISLLFYVVVFAILASKDLQQNAWVIARYLPTGLEHISGELATSHVVAHAPLGALLVLGWGKRIEPPLLGLAALTISTLIEPLQEFVPGRTAEWWDVVSNGLGIFLGTTLATLATGFGTSRGQAGSSGTGGSGLASRRRRGTTSAPRSVGRPVSHEPADPWPLRPEPAKRYALFRATLRHALHERPSNGPDSGAGR